MKNYKPILLFGSLLAILAIALQFFEYKYFIGSLDTDIYTSVVATIFTVVGVWIGMNLLKAKKEPTATPAPVPTPQESKSTPSIDQQAIKALKLNDREYEVLQLIAQGLTNQQIADQLFLALPTIKTHTSNLYAKLEVRSRTQAVHKAREINIL